MVDMARFIKPILAIVPPDPASIDPRPLLPLAGPAPELPEADRAPAGGLRPAHDDVGLRLPEPVVRDRSAEGHDVRLGDHRDVPGRSIAGHGLRPAAPLHGRDRRRLPRLGHPEGRHRRHLQRHRQCSPSEWRGDPHGSAGRQNRGQGRARQRRDPRVRRGARGRRRSSRRSTSAGPSSTSSSPARSTTSSRPRSAASSSAAPRARSTWPSTRCRASRPSRARASTSAARSPSPRRSRTWSGPTTTRSTASSAAKPYIDIIIPTLVDPSMAPPGKHIMSCFVQYAPYNLDPSLGGWDNQREAFGDAVVNRIAEFAPDLPSKILHRNVHDAARHRADDRPDRGQHLPGRALARAAVLQPAGARLGALPDPDQGPLARPAPRPTRAAGSWAPTAASRPSRSCARCGGGHERTLALENDVSGPRPETYWDAVIIGAGHNALVTAAYLATAGQADARARAARPGRRRGRHGGARARASASPRWHTPSDGFGRRSRRTSRSRGMGSRWSHRTCGSSRRRRRAGP